MKSVKKKKQFTIKFRNLKLYVDDLLKPYSETLVCVSVDCMKYQTV